MFRDRLQLVNVRVENDGYPNCVFMTFRFKVKRLPKDIGMLDDIATEKIKKMFSFKVNTTRKCFWADVDCKYIDKMVMFTVDDINILCESEKVK